MKKIISLFIALAMSLSVTLPLKSFAESSNQEDIISLVEQYVDVTEDGFIKLELTDSLIQDIGKENYESFLSGIETINSLISIGELSVTDNGTIYELNDDELIVQGGNVDKVTYHWWGIRRYASNSSTKEIIDYFSTVSNGAGIACGGTAAIGLIFPAALPASAFSGVGAGYFGLLASRISANNKGRGVIIDLTYVLVFNIKPQ